MKKISLFILLFVFVCLTSCVTDTSMAVFSGEFFEKVEGHKMITYKCTLELFEKSKEYVLTVSSNEITSCGEKLAPCIEKGTYFREGPSSNFRRYNFVSSEPHERDFTAIQRMVGNDAYLETKCGFWVPRCINGVQSTEFLSFKEVSFVCQNAVMFPY